MVTSVLRHRRSGRVWRACAVLGALALVAVGATAGYRRVAAGSDCAGGQVRLTVYASTDQFDLMTGLAEQFNAAGRRVSGHCAEVHVRPAVPSAVAAHISASWDEQRDGPRPDVWVPDSSVWLLLAAARPEARAVLPSGAAPSLASSPVVLAMQRPMAQALGWPGREIGLTDLLRTSWARLGHPEWGPLRLGMSDPTTSTPGLVSVLTILDPDNDGTLGADELVGSLAFAQVTGDWAEDTDGLLSRYADRGRTDAPSSLPAAVPVLERDLGEYASESPGVDLVPVYLREGTTFADYPYTVLRAPWVDRDRQRLAAEFLDYLRADPAQKAYARAGFRDPSHAAQDSTLLDPTRGFRLEVTGPQRAPTAETLTQLTQTWASLQRPNNALLALDTSGSMNDLVPGTTQTRLQLVQQAAVQGAETLNAETTIGLWEFSSQLTPSTDYRELVPPGRAGEKVGGVERRQAIIDAVRRLRAAGGTGLYDTVYAAYLRMQQAWRPDARNLLVVMTDGRNSDDEGLSLAELIQRLRAAARPDRPVPVIGIAVGPRADAGALQEISKATGGRTVVARDDLAAVQEIALAFAGRIGYGE
ncbi:MAG: VWA domain-containing protein [Micromonosporaceae bacterium]|jgi:Ca-activated chloride channel family protein|nr:VWA domain-containing protein [Micromonosporaceae bacterium]